MPIPGVEIPEPAGLSRRFLLSRKPDFRNVDVRNRGRERLDFCGKRSSFRRKRSPKILRELNRLEIRELASPKLQFRVADFAGAKFCCRIWHSPTAVTGTLSLARSARRGGNLRCTKFRWQPSKCSAARAALSGISAGVGLRPLFVRLPKPPKAARGPALCRTEHSRISAGRSRRAASSGLAFPFHSS